MRPRRRPSWEAGGAAGLATAPPQPPRADPAASAPPAADPFADEIDAGPAAVDAKKKGKEGAEGFAVHVRMQQRNGRKSLTTVQGLPEAFDYKKVLKALKKGEPRGLGV